MEIAVAGMRAETKEGCLFLGFAYLDTMVVCICSLRRRAKKKYVILIQAIIVIAYSVIVYFSLFPILPEGGGQGEGGWGVWHHLL